MNSDGSVFYSKRHCVVEANAKLYLPYKDGFGGVEWASTPFFFTEEYADVVSSNSYYSSGRECYKAREYANLADELVELRSSVFGVWSVAPDGSWDMEEDALIEYPIPINSDGLYGYGKRAMLRRAEAVLMAAIPVVLNGRYEDYYQHWKEMYEYFTEQCAHDVVAVIGRMLDDYLPTMPRRWSTLWDDVTSRYFEIDKATHAAMFRRYAEEVANGGDVDAVLRTLGVPVDIADSTN